jgi:WD40 repeat protein
MAIDQLEKCRQWLNNPWPFIGGWQQRRAINLLRRDGSPQAVQLLAGTTWRGDGAGVRSMAVEALRDLARDQNRPAQEALCRFVMHHDHPILQEVLDTGYLPAEESQRALFLFLTQQWEAYEGLDFDHSLLRAVYEAGHDELRKRIAAVARDAGRLEWVGIASGGRHGRRLAAMTDAEWKAALVVLFENERWSDMWKLAQDAPPRWSAPLLRRLKTVFWSPANDAQPEFDELVRRAEQFHEGDFSQSMEVRAVLRGHTDEVRCIAFSPDGRILASGSGDKTVRFWDLAEGHLLKTLEGHRAAVNCLAIASDGRSLVSGGKDSAVMLWRLPSAETAMRLKGHSEMVLCLAVSPDGRLLATGSADSAIQLWSLPAGQSLATLEGHKESVLDLAITPDGRMLVSAAGDGTVRLWSLPDGNAIRTLRGHRADDLDAVLCLAVSSDGSLLASSGTDNNICLWTLPGGQALATLEGHLGPVQCLAINPRGTVLASGAADQMIRLWQLPEGRPLATWEAHSSDVTRLAMSPSGDVLASASGSGLGHDHSVRLWSLSARKPIKTLDGHTRYVTCVAMSPDGRYLASGSGDGTVRLWTSELTRLSHLPVRQATAKDLAWAQGACAKNGLPDQERKAWEFIAALLRRRHRHDVELGETAARLMEIGEFDIEIEG